MRQIMKTTAFAALVVLATAACADLEVVNPNDPDAGRAIGNPEDVEALIGGALNTWHEAFYTQDGPGPFLSSQSFQHSSTPANFAMYYYSDIPRAPVQNDPAAGRGYDYFVEPWYESYAALAAVSEGLRALETDPTIADALGADRVQRMRAFGKFVQGMAHATIAILFDQGFILDETTDVSDPLALEPVGYQEMMAAAMGYFDEAIALSQGASFSIPANWYYQTETDAATFAKIAHSEKARFRPAVARTPEERAAVDWAAVIADVDAGVGGDYVVSFDGDFGWYAGVIDYGNYPGWSQGSYFILGMADQSGNYQTWLSLPPRERLPDLPSGDPFVIVTPDTRFAQGTTLDEQRQNPGEVWMIPCEVEGDDPAIGEPCFGDFALSNMWVRAARGTWRWSYYWSAEYGAYNFGIGDYTKLNEIDDDGQRLLKAEALYHMGDFPGAAALVNVSRTEHGLNATAGTAAGTNTSCVPKLPDGTCGDLWEMLKWEKRMEARFVGLFMAPWYFDSRGWGDLYAGTQLQFPIPCQELNILERLPCYAFGGVGGQSSSAGSNYAWPAEP